MSSEKEITSLGADNSELAAPLVSTIVPCFKQARYLSVALASMKAQTLTDWECIIIDDGSPDNTAEVASQWTLVDARFKYVYQNNGGVSCARNTGLSLARGRFIHFLDADDFIADDFLSLAVTALRKNPAAALSFCGWILVGPEGGLISKGEVPETTSDWFHFMLEGCLCPCHAIVVRKCLVEQVGGFDKNLRANEDWDIWLRIALKNQHFTRIRTYGAYYRQHNQSMSWNYRRMLKSGLSVIHKYSKVHLACSACNEAVLRGEENLAAYVWDISQQSVMDGYWNRGYFGKYLCRSIYLGTVHRRWAFQGLSRLANSKRHIVNVLLKRLRIRIHV